MLFTCFAGVNQLPYIILLTCFHFSLEQDFYNDHFKLVKSIHFQLQKILKIGAVLSQIWQTLVFRNRANRHYKSGQLL